MSSRKTNNSILVLATLGVYLGLVLIGATPQVLAQAAMTKQFNVKDEIEVKDEFDNNPDIEELKSLIENALEGTISSFVSTARKREKNTAQNFNAAKPFAIRTFRNFCSEEQVEVIDPLARSSGSNPIKDLHRSLDLASNWSFASVPGFVQAQDQVRDQKFCRTFGVTTTLDSNELSLKIFFSRATSTSAFRLAGYLNEFLFERAHGIPDPITKQVYERTRATSDYANLVIVTRLPRAGLDALLASNAK